MVNIMWFDHVASSDANNFKICFAKYGHYAKPVMEITWLKRFYLGKNDTIILRDSYGIWEP